MCIDVNAVIGMAGISVDRAHSCSWIERRIASRPVVQEGVKQP